MNKRGRASYARAKRALTGVVATPQHEAGCGAAIIARFLNLFADLQPWRAQK